MGAARIITNLDYSIRFTRMFETLKWQPIKTILNKRKLITMMIKVLKGMEPNCLKTLFHVCNNTSCQLRTIADRMA